MSSKDRPQLKRPVPPRAKSVSSKPPHPQTRTRKPHPLSSTSTVYKTHSDSALTNGFRRLRIQDDKSTNGGSAGSTGSVQPVRRRLSSAGHGCKNLQDIAQFITNKNAKNIIVMAGAGISTPSGIPDFRTPGTGLYDNIKQYNIPYPEAIFDIDYFERYPRPFYTLAKELYPNGTYLPNYIHYFLRLLNDKGLLLRIYTQNIDGLERIAGIPAQKLVEAHGNFLSVSCVRCKQQHDSELIKNAIYADRLPRCMRNGCTGLVKPDIVFFGEDLPRRFYYYLKDFPQADLLLVMGTSLQVEPFADITDSVRLYVPRVLFNRNIVGPFVKKKRANDVVSKGDIIEQLKVLVGLLGWNDDLQNLIDVHKEKVDQAQTQVSKGPEDCSCKDNKDISTKSADKSEEVTASDTASTVSLGSTSSNTGISRQKQSQSSVTSGPFSRRPPIPNNFATTRKNIADIKRMVRLNNTSKTRAVTANSKFIGSNKQTLPRIGHRPISFHAQRSLFRTNNPRLMQTESSSEESSESDSDD